MLESLLSRPRVLVCSCLLVAVGTLSAHPTWARSIGADVWNVPALNEQVRTSEVEDDRLTAEGDDVLRRIAIKEAIITELLAGRTTLADASERFAALNGARPDYVATLREVFPGATDQETYARNVISFALPRVPAQDRDALSSRLEAELQQILASATTH